MKRVVYYNSFKMSRDELRDRLSGCELDLSMDSLSVVPVNMVKEMAAIPRATQVDLSCNQLTMLPDIFCTLTHLIKLDLSKNKLKMLPAEFGALNKLQHLDLFENQLESLPVSMFKLKKLKYLDLKSNPLNEALSRVAGDCMDDVQCKQCALKVVKFMREVNSEQDRRTQRELQLHRDAEAARLAEEEEEKQRIKAAKLELKEQRRRQYELEQVRKLADTQARAIAAGAGDAVPTTNGVKKEPVQKATFKSGLFKTTILVSILVLALAVFVGLAYYCDQNPKIPNCDRGIKAFWLLRKQTRELYADYIARFVHNVQNVQK